MLNSPQGLQAATDATRRAASASGFGSTILTGPLGDLTPPNLGKKTLLGA